jgi:hypothetical protein
MGCPTVLIGSGGGGGGGDDGVVTRRWNAKNAWIMKISYSDFDSGSFEMIEETFVIGYDDIEEEWPATANPE